ncbi:DNA-3-methyladenine glycosylase family protein [Algihabitans albus]|uniref:DNA-3-methyladenine glycosylase family protein n=1 Tax=Algihabitans albus TaxID=2164067 RepID=UPI000E5CC243|nr:DNA-3-methyladenine glycosylase [Algihabitans albus]
MKRDRALIVTQETLPAALEALGRIDADFLRALEEVGLPPLRYRAPGFATLLRIIIAQQVSLASAQAIADRLAARCDPITPETFLALTDEDLRAIGLSRPKQRYARALAETVGQGAIDLEQLTTLDDEAAIDSLTRAKGIGRWSAQVYLLFSLGRADVFPADDIGLMTGAQLLKGLEVRPDARTLAGLAEAWRPYRAVAARMLWHYRRQADAIPDDWG